jgi:hypothetical protein
MVIAEGFNFDIVNNMVLLYNSINYFLIKVMLYIIYAGFKNDDFS